MSSGSRSFSTHPSTRNPCIAGPRPAAPPPQAPGPARRRPRGGGIRGPGPASSAGVVMPLALALAAAASSLPDPPDGCPADASEAANTSSPGTYWDAPCSRSTCAQVYDILHCPDTQLICPACSGACCAPTPPSPPSPAPPPPWQCEEALWRTWIGDRSKSGRNETIFCPGWGKGNETMCNSAVMVLGNGSFRLCSWQEDATDVWSKCRFMENFTCSFFPSPPPLLPLPAPPPSTPPVRTP